MRDTVKTRIFEQMKREYAREHGFIRVLEYIASVLANLNDRISSLEKR